MLADFINGDAFIWHQQQRTLFWTNTWRWGNLSLYSVLATCGFSFLENYDFLWWNTKRKRADYRKKKMNGWDNCSSNLPSHWFWLTDKRKRWASTLALFVKNCRCVQNDFLNAICISCNICTSTHPKERSPAVNLGAQWFSCFVAQIRLLRALLTIIFAVMSHSCHIR